MTICQKIFVEGGRTGSIPINESLKNRGSMRRVDLYE